MRKSLRMMRREIKMKTSNREFRNIPLERFELRAEGENAETMNVRGYASTFEEYVLFEDGEDKFMERIEPTAFEGCDMSDVVFRKDHEGTVFARTSNGALKLDVDKHGLLTDTDLSRTASARQMYEEIKAGMYTQMSFAFVVDDDEVVRDKDNHTYTRIIKHIAKLYDVSPVSFPANPGTDIYARSRFDGAIEAEQQELLHRAKMLELAKAKARAIM
jgi:HK97 family phage prohead protease